MAQQTSLKLCTDHQARVVIVLTCGFPEGAGPQLKCWRSQMCSVAGDSCYLPLWRGKKKKKVHLLFSLEGKLKWHISMTATNNFVLFLFHFSCAHMKCEIIALNILASLAEQLTVASFITYYLTDASNTESVNLIMV